MIYRPLGDLAGNTEGVACPPQQGLVRHPLSCEPLQVARALTGEWPVAMALENGRVREQRLEHGVHLQVQGTTNAAELCCELVGEGPVIPAT